MRSVTFILPLVVFAFGVGFGTLVSVQFAVIIWLLLLGLVLGLLWRFRPSSRATLVLGICIVAGALGLFRIEIASWQFGNSELESAVGQTVELTGTVVREPDFREQTVHLYVAVADDVLLVTTDRLAAMQYGDAVVVTGKLTAPESFETELDWTFDYPGYLLARGVEYRVGFAEVAVTGSGGGNPFITGILSVKHAFMAALERAVPEPQVALGQGLLLGVKQSLGDDIEEDFRRTGIIHIVVLSGYNVMLVASFMLFCLSFLLPLRARVIGGIIAIVLFALLVGLSATVVRASIMASVLLIAQGLGRTYEVTRALFAAGAVMLLVNPYLLVYDIGLQLSFMATLGLVLLLPQFESTVQRSGFVSLRSFFWATVVTQIAVLPLLLYHIGQVSVVAVIVNVLVLPVVPIAMLLTFTTGTMALVAVSVAQFIGLLATASLTYILVVAERFSAVPFAAVTVPEFTPVQVLVSYGVLGALWYWWQRRKTSYDEWTIEEERETGAEPSGTAPVEVPQIFR